MEFYHLKEFGFSVLPGKGRVWHFISKLHSEFGLNVTSSMKFV